METHPECVPCLLRRCLFEARAVDEEKERRVIDEVLPILDELFEEGAVSAEVATEVHGKVYEILGTSDPYSEMKKKSNENAEYLLEKAKDLLENGSFKDVVLVSIIGNVLDFGYREDIESADYLLEEFDNLLDEGLGYDDTGQIKKVLEDAESVIFFTDNAGEIVFDTLLLKKIKEYDVHLTVVVKGEPILTDATMEDALKYDIDEIADQLETTGGYAVGVDFDKLSQKVKTKLEGAGLIIAKGMANWESFSETDYAPIAFLTRSKCRPVSETMGVPFDKNVAKLFEGTVSVAD
ncbi:MAG: ARMT1-like domain-containing protein [Candidatus Thermoplasmatota archaeon]